jgi:bifunctional non-homologous end joining protein LigD
MAPRRASKTPRQKPGSAGDQEPEAIEIAGVRLTSPHRVLWDEQDVTKQELAEFYVDIADRLLPYIVGRPLTLVRCPAGSEKTCFFQKHPWAGLSEHIERLTLRHEGKDDNVLLVRDIQGVVGLVQAGVLEIHPWGARIEDVDRPDQIIFDFDPGEGVGWPQIIAGARAIRERLDALKLRSFVKTTGGKGLHVVAPLTPGAGWDEAKAFTHALADAMVADEPERYTTASLKAEREGRIFIDYLRNTRGATAVAPYSTRARQGAPVSTPLAWDELSPDMPSNQYTVANLRERLKGLEDPWADFFKVRQRLPDRTKVG